MKSAKRLIIIITAVLVTIVSLIIYYNNVIVVRNETIKSDLFSEDIDGYTIIYFSDLHYTNFINEKYLNRLVEKINDENPDIVIFGGDLINKLQDKQISNEDKENLINELSKINNTNGKYAILGNHDYSEGSYEYVKDIYSKSDFTLLKDNCVSIKINEKDTINILGIDSLFFSWDMFLESYNNIDTNNYTIGVIHHPDLVEYMPNTKFDYVLSGHSHGGQIYIPLLKNNYNIYGCTKFFKGKYETCNNIKQYTIDVSSGVGRTRINMRLFTNSEIVKYKLKKEITK